MRVSETHSIMTSLKTILFIMNAKDCMTCGPSGSTVKSISRYELLLKCIWTTAFSQLKCSCCTCLTKGIMIWLVTVYEFDTWHAHFRSILDTQRCTSIQTLWHQQHSGLPTYSVSWHTLCSHRNISWIFQQTRQDQTLIKTFKITGKVLRLNFSHFASLPSIDPGCLRNRLAKWNKSSLWET